ncbi:MAG: type II secretion system protein [Vulcanimicrobiota bacterium]
MSGARRGLSLVELLVVCFLVGLLGLAFVSALLPTMQAMARASAQTELQQQAVLCLERIERELRSSTSTGVGILSQALVGPGQNPGLFLTPLKDVDGQGQPNWDPRIVAIWWDRSDGRVRSKTWPPKDPPSLAHEPGLNRPAGLSRLEFADLINGRNGSERFLAAGVTDFDAVHGGSGTALVPPLTVQIELSRQEGHHREKFKLKRVVSLRTL